jgi:RecA/RadA recombinase
MNKADRKRAISTLVNKINARAKHTVIGRADRLSNKYMLRRPSGIMSLDVQLRGGVPATGVTILAGPESSGKTFLMYQFMKMNQRIHGENSAVAVAPVEHPFDHLHCRKQGLLVAVPDSRIEMEQAFRKSLGWPLLTKSEIQYLKLGIGEVLGIVADNMDDMLNIVLECVSKNCFQIIGVDSITAANPESQVAADDVSTFGQQGIHATVLGKFYKLYSPYTNGFEGDDGRTNETTLLFTQQARSNRAKADAGPRGKYMKDWDASGSSCSSKHFKMVELTVWSGKREKETVEKGQRANSLGKTINWEITKGKGGIFEGQVGEMEYSFENFVDVYASIVTAGIQCGVLVERNGLVDTIDPLLQKPIEGIEALPLQALVESMVQDWDVEEKVRKAIVYANTKVSCLYR